MAILSELPTTTQPTATPQPDNAAAMRAAKKQALIAATKKARKDKQLHTSTEAMKVDAVKVKEDAPEVDTPEDEPHKSDSEPVLGQHPRNRYSALASSSEEEGPGPEEICECNRPCFQFCGANGCRKGARCRFCHHPSHRAQKAF